MPGDRRTQWAAKTSLDGRRLVLWDLGFGNIVLVAGKKTELSLKRALRYGESVRTLELLRLSNDKSESMLLGVRDRKRPTPYS